MATPWSPPGWMKTSGSMIGGTPVSLIIPQNEPEYSPSNYPGSTLTASQEASLIDDLGPDLQKAGLSIKIIAYDHNWDDTTFPETVLGDPTAGPYVAGVAWHCYAGDPSAQTTVHNAYPNVGTYFTECSGTQSANPADTFADSLDWQTEASKFVKPGAVRIDSNTFGSGNLEDVAFQNPDGSDALIALNADTSSAHTFNVDENGQYFSYTLPAGAVATFTWTPGSTSTGGGGTGINSTTWYQVVNSGSGDCVDDTNGGTSNSTAVQQWACGAGNSNQEWQFQPTSNGYYQVVSRTAPSLGWDVTNRSTANGAQLQQWACTTGDTAQTFRLVPES